MKSLKKHKGLLAAPDWFWGLAFFVSGIAGEVFAQTAEYYTVHPSADGYNLLISDSPIGLSEQDHTNRDENIYSNPTSIPFHLILNRDPLSRRLPIILDADVVVRWEIIPGAGTNPAQGPDFLYTTGTVTFDAPLVFRGVVAEPFPILRPLGTVDDDLNEGDEEFLLRFRILAGRARAAIGSTKRIIISGDRADSADVAYGFTGGDLAEGSATTWHITLSGAVPLVPWTMDYSATGDGITNADYSLEGVSGIHFQKTGDGPRRVTIEPGAFTKTFLVRAVDDGDNEAREQLTLSFYRPYGRRGVYTSGTNVSQSLFIPASDPTTYSLASEQVTTIAEGTTAAFPLVARGGAPTVPATFAWSIVGAGPYPATASDFARVTGTTTVAPGEPPAILIHALEDLLAEGNERFVLHLDGVSFDGGGDVRVAGRSSAAATILYSTRGGLPVVVERPSYRVVEGTTLPVTVRLREEFSDIPDLVATGTVTVVTQPQATEFGIGVAYAGDIRTRGAPFRIDGGGATRTTVSIAIADDGLWEEDETFTLTLSGADAQVPAAATVVIEDDEVVEIGFDFTDYHFSETTMRHSEVACWRMTSPPASLLNSVQHSHIFARRPIQVSVTTSATDAQHFTDFGLSSPDGLTLSNLQVPYVYNLSRWHYQRHCLNFRITVDEEAEETEQFHFHLQTTQSGVDIVTPTANVHIFDNDTVTVGLERDYIVEEGRTAPVCVVASHPPTIDRDDFWLQLSTSETGSAVAGSHYRAFRERRVGPLNGTTRRACVDVEAMVHLEDSGVEDFSLELTKPAGLARVEISTATVAMTITKGDVVVAALNRESRFCTAFTPESRYVVCYVDLLDTDGGASPLRRDEQRDARDRVIVEYRLSGTARVGTQTDAARDYYVDRFFADYPYETNDSSFNVATSTGTVPISFNAQRGQIILELHDDNRNEGREQITIELLRVLAGPSRIRVFDYVRNTATTTIIDNDPIVVRVSSPSSATEGRPTTYSVSLSAAPTRPVRVPWRVTTSTETTTPRAAPEDFVGAFPRAGALVFTADDWVTRSVSVVVAHDGLTEEEAEYFHWVVTPSAISGAYGAARVPTTRSEVMILASNQLTVRLTVLPIQLLTEDFPETLLSNSAVSFHIWLTDAGGATAQPTVPVVVAYRLSGTAVGGATEAPGIDYLYPFGYDVGLRSGDEMLTSADPATHIPIYVSDDELNEPRETIEIELLGITGGHLQVAWPPPQTTASFAIADDDPITLVTRAPPGAVAEGASATFSVALSNPPTRTVRVPYRITTSTETTIPRAAPEDFVGAFPRAGALVFTADDYATRSVSIAVAADGRPEDAEYFDLVVTPSAISGTYGTARVSPTRSEARIAPGRVWVSAKVFLEGAFAFNPSTDTMNTPYLRSLPARQPYDVNPWWHGATTTIPHLASAHGVSAVTDTIVDWVLVELRAVPKNAGIRAATASSRMAERRAWVRAALLLANGAVVGVDENAPTAPGALATRGVVFDVVIDAARQDLYVLIHHRNHLPIISTASATTTNCVADYCVDFTTRQSRQGTQKDLGGGRFAMRAGDVNRNGSIALIEREFIVTHNGKNIMGWHYSNPGVLGNYIVDADLNFDEAVSLNDREFIVINDRESLCDVCAPNP